MLEKYKFHAPSGKSSPVNTTDLKAQYATQTAAVKQRYDSLQVAYNGEEHNLSLTSNSMAEASPYYYHSDHLGSSSLITGVDGSTVQHLEYVPYGEVFIDERQASNSWTTPYKFSGKERDEETGLLYFGARYQDSKYGIWYSVDPLAEKYPGISSYVYCSDNPTNRIDPDGRLDMDRKTQKQYPALTKYIKGLAKEWDGKSSEFKKAFMERSGLNENQVKEMLTFGKGPKLKVADLDKLVPPANGTTDGFPVGNSSRMTNGNGGKGLIKIDDNIAKMMENAQTGKERGIANIMVESTTFHELTHVGNLTVNGSFDGNFSPDSGKSFETNVYGKDINRSNVKSYWESIQPKIIPAPSIPLLQIQSTEVR